MDHGEFLSGMMLFFCSGFEEKLKLVFNLYDYDGDGMINRNDIVPIITAMPLNKTANVRGEGKFTKEGGGA